MNSHGPFHRSAITRQFSSTPFSWPPCSPVAPVLPRPIPVLGRPKVPSPLPGHGEKGTQKGPRSGGGSKRRGCCFGSVVANRSCRWCRREADAGTVLIAPPPAERRRGASSRCSEMRRPGRPGRSAVSKQACLDVSFK